MNVCLLGEYDDQLDEGIKNTSVKLYQHLKRTEHSVTLVDLRTIGSLRFWNVLRQLEPDVVHLIPGPTPQGLLFLRAFGRWKRAKTVATTTQPRFVSQMLTGASVLAPDKLIVQSTDLQQQFSAAGFDTTFVPSGVDLDAFGPVSASEKLSLRRELGLPEDERIFLHVGHFKRGRNVLDLKHLQEFGTVVVIGSPSTGPEEEVVSELRSAGCVVVTEYVEQIARYYQASDVYVFPTRDEENSIQTPLSVFEAMACNLPVIATRFGGLGDCFDEGDGLHFVSDVSEVDEALLSEEAVATRDKVSAYSWESIGETVVEIYEGL